MKRFFLAALAAFFAFAFQAAAQPTFSAGEGSTPVALSLTATVQTVFTVPSGSRRLLTGVHLVNSSATACWAQWFDGAATLGSTAPKWPIYVPPANGLFNGTFDYSFSPVEIPAFLTGMITTPGGSTACASPMPGAVFYR